MPPNVGHPFGEAHPFGMNETSIAPKLYGSWGDMILYLWPAAAHGRPAKGPATIPHNRPGVWRTVLAVSASGCTPAERRCAVGVKRGWDRRFAFTNMDAAAATERTPGSLPRSYGVIRGIVFRDTTDAVPHGAPIIRSAPGFLRIHGPRCKSKSETGSLKKSSSAARRSP